MIALLIHFLGFLLINSAVPPYIESADAYFLAWWYAAFASVDMIAICFAAPRLRILLVMSFAWSAALSFETFMLQNTMQRNDQAMQHLIDIVLFGYLIVLMWRYRATQRRTE